MVSPPLGRECLHSHTRDLKTPAHKTWALLETQFIPLAMADGFLPLLLLASRVDMEDWTLDGAVASC